jgi:hypothetical protein
MYRYINSAVSLENLRQQAAKPIFDDNPYGEEIFKQLVEVDPTADYDNNKGGKYAPWIIRQYNKGALSPEDFTNLKDALKHFATQPKKYLHSDLGQYKTVKEFLEDAERVGNMPLTEKEKAKQLKKQAHHASTEDKEFITSDGVWELWVPKTHAGSISLAREGGTKARWCTAYDGNDYYWKQYTEGSRAGKLYIFLNTSNPKEKYQLHFESNSWFDIEDDSLGMDKFYEFIADKPNFAEYFKVTDENGLLMRAGVIVGINPDIKELVIPDTVENLSVSSIPSGLVSITYPDSWTKWSGPSLTGLDDLNYIHLPDSLTVIPVRKIVGCISLTKVDMPSNLTSIEAGNFAGCESLTKLALPDSLVKIGSNCFVDSGIRNFVFPPKLSVIPSRLFNRCKNLEYVDLNNVAVIRSEAFADAEVGAISNINHVIRFDSGCFTGSTIAELDLNPEALLGSYAFYGCKHLTGSVTLLNSMKLGVSTFDNCPELTIYWSRDDDDYEFDNIKKLICSNVCKDLIAANKGYIEIETIEGDHYDAEV